jgi:hypothetical protein
MPTSQRQERVISDEARAKVGGAQKLRWKKLPCCATGSRLHGDGAKKATATKKTVVKTTKKAAKEAGKKRDNSDIPF